MPEEFPMPKAYEAKDHEDQIYADWLASGYFTPENLPDLENRKEIFSMVLPPPNVTGTLHMGHAVMLALQDAMVRLARLQGKRALWIPGTDHAAIATQSKVEKIIQKEEGKTRHDLGREEFLKRVNKFAQDSHDVIVNQAKKMGASLDWNREAYTLDAARNHAVNVAFKAMYEKGLIYQGGRIVNWDPVGQTTISDDEIVYKEEKTKFYYFKYGPFVIGTARPETKFGDKYVVMHPDDERYSQYQHGQKIELEWINGPMTATIIKDESADMEFGTGVMTITPWHSQVDFEIAQRHELDKEQIIDLNGNLLPIAGEFAGMGIGEAREKIVEKLQKKGLVEKIDEDYVHNISTAERTSGLVEPQILKQWFVGVNREFEAPNGQTTTLKELMINAVKSGDVEIIPERFNKTYFHWIDNLRDWCISRQIWFGHRIPVWRRQLNSKTRPGGFGMKGEQIFIGGESPGGDEWVQDPDTLDTWFSSGLWTFSTLGWPDVEAPDFKMYHPTTVLETGYDIIFFWVARMILMSTALLGVAPFKTVYLHGLVRDEQGRKMSKSLDNIINPLDMIAEYGADATRLSLILGATPGNDSKLSPEKVAGFRNFTNKLWNISRFVFMSVESVKVIENVEPVTLADRWILGRLSEVITACSKHAAKHEYSLYGEVLRDFTWNEFADWYLEIAKVEKNKSDVLLYVLERLLILWHPFMPFVTEEIYKQFNNGMLMVAKWPRAEFELAKKDGEAFATLQTAVVDIRNLRAEHKVEPKVLVDATIMSSPELESCSEVIKTLARVENLSFGKAAEGGVATKLVTVYLKIDVEQERVRLSEELADKQRYSASLTGKLANADFVARAPVAVVDLERQKLAETNDRITAIESQLKSFM